MDVNHYKRKPIGYDKGAAKVLGIKEFKMYWENIKEKQ